MQETPYLTNVIASKDINELSSEELHTSAAPNLLFSIEQLCGERECVVVAQNALQYAANASIEDTAMFTDALVKYAHSGEEVFFEADYNNFISAFPFKPDDDIMRIGIQVIPSVEGFRFQTLTLLSTGELMHDPYYMFLPTQSIEAARGTAISEEYSQKIFEAMVVEFPGQEPTPGSNFADLVNASIPISATLATIGISLLALRSECLASSELDLPVLQQEKDLPKLVSLSLA